MIAELKVFADCTSQNPSKTYPIYQIPSHIQAKLADLDIKVNKDMPAEEAIKELDKTFKIMIPTITDEELNCISLKNKFEVLYAVANEFNGLANEAAKN